MKKKGLELYLEENSLADILVILGDQEIEFNRVEECTWEIAGCEAVHEKMSAKIAYVGGILEDFRNNHTEAKAQYRKDEAGLWLRLKRELTNEKGTAYSDKIIDMEVAASKELDTELAQVNYLSYCVKRLDRFVEDMRGARVSMETSLKTRIL